MEVAEGELDVGVEEEELVVEVDELSEVAVASVVDPIIGYSE